MCTEIINMAGRLRLSHPRRLSCREEWQARGDLRKARLQTEGTGGTVAGFQEQDGCTSGTQRNLTLGRRPRSTTRSALFRSSSTSWTRTRRTEPGRPRSWQPGRNASAPSARTRPYWARHRRYLAHSPVGNREVQGRVRERAHEQRTPSPRKREALARAPGSGQGSGHDGTAAGRLLQTARNRPRKYHGEFSW